MVYLATKRRLAGSCEPILPDSPFELGLDFDPLACVALRLMGKFAKAKLVAEAIGERVKVVQELALSALVFSGIVLRRIPGGVCLKKCLTVMLH